MIVLRKIIFLLALMASVLLTACPAPPESPSPDSIEGLTLSSDLVIVGKVLQNQSSWQNGHIVTTSNVQPLQTLKGITGGETLQVSFLGGTAGNIKEHVEHSTSLQPGQITVLFLKQSTKAVTSAPALSIVSERGSITLVHPGERESRLTNNRRLIRRLEEISTRVQLAGGAK